ncbi:cytochrome P450 [Mycobacteroides chelonae]|nr:cytochrome P450 [Mycobacteroides chelonae]
MAGAQLYDPFWDEAMRDPRDLYAGLRKHDPVHYISEYDAWAVASFEAVWAVCRSRDFTTTRGMPPNSSLLGEAGGNGNFTEVPYGEHILRRRILLPGYRPDAVRADDAVIRARARAVLSEVLVSCHGTMDVFADYASRVTAYFAALKAGLPEGDAESIRRASSGFLTRISGQKGSSKENYRAAAKVFGYLTELVASARLNPEEASGDLKVLIDAELGGKPLADEQVVGDLFTILITGSETTEIAVAATLYYLAEHRAQLAQVQSNPALIPLAFAEAIRYDHPTDLLCRQVLNETEISGRRFSPGQSVILLWGSACLDEAEFPRADVFDIHRRYKRHLLFGVGPHRCLGEHAAVRMGTIILEEFFAAIEDYEVDFENCTRRYAEFVKGYNAVPVSYRRR